MAKYLNPTVVLDGLLDKIATGTSLAVCSAQPSVLGDIATYALATTSLTGGSYTKANGDVSGRKISIYVADPIAITATGTATHVVVYTATDILLVTTSTSQVLTSGGTVTVPTFKCETASPT